MTKALSEEELGLLGELRRRHPGRKTACGAVLAEIVAGTDSHDRGRAMSLFMRLRCRGGHRALERIVKELQPRVDDPNDPAGESGSKEWSLCSGVICTIGSIDNATSHEILARLLATLPSGRTKADVLEGMGFERKQFDPALAIPFLSPDTPVREILSALYALEYNDYSRKQPEDAERRLRPLLQSPNPQVRQYALVALRSAPQFRPLVLALSDDPDPYVRQVVGEVLRWMDMLEDRDDA
jgi:hypothetical protein